MFARDFPHRRRRKLLGSTSRSLSPSAVLLAITRDGGRLWEAASIADSDIELLQDVGIVP